MRLTHLMRLILVAVSVLVMAGLGLAAKQLFTPESFGMYGHYRADAIGEEESRDIRHGTNASCLSCHPYVAGSHLKGRHQTISCEFCHGAYADHAREGKKIAALPVKKNKEIITLCVRCHNKEIEARPTQVIKTVSLPEHLEKQTVKLTHTCDQCHYVHAPLKYINQAKRMTRMTEAANDN